MGKKYVFSIIVFLLVIPVLGADSYTDVTVSEAKTMIDSNPSLVILDVRTQSEYDEGHIRNAKLIPHTELVGRLNELNEADAILVYCRTGVRSSIASQILVDNGFSNVYNMLEGITAWISEGYPIYVKYSSIQEALNNANEGNTIFVSSGVYYEDIVVNKSVSLVGENKYNTIIDGNGTQIIEIRENDTTLAGFTVRNGSTGILLYYSSNSNISNNIIANISMYGISFSDSNNNTVSDNLLLNISQYGLLLSNSRNNLICRNQINQTAGILDESGGNTYIENTIFAHRITYEGPTYEIPMNIWSSNNIIQGNVILNGSRVIISGSKNNVSYNVIMNNEMDGIFIDGESNTIIGNNLTSNENGISLFYSNDNTIVDNNIVNCKQHGMWIYSSFNNIIYNNNLVNNGKQVDVQGSVNSWDDGLGAGNYWSDYEEKYPYATEIDESGIWNTPYVVDANNIDRYPLVIQFIIPEFPSLLILPLFMIATLLAVIAYRRKCSPK
ncbi:MAG: right-handed parallel beta-helix repeat-containing protein [Candidatus Bathyarchaeota archaeon]|nr:right-handed parallel beta-helix repeat-containing protein [Candidatus Bathyarchaeota archaeon]